MKFLNNFWRSTVKLGEPDWPLLFTAGAIVIFGIIMLTSASGAFAYSRYNDGYYFIRHQLSALVVGLLLFAIFYKIDYHLWRKYASAFLVLSGLLLLIVFIPGLASSANTKAHSWISIFGFSLQTSEFVKLFLLIYLAAWFESNAGKLTNFSEGVMPLFVILTVVGVLLLKQPDFGTLSIVIAMVLAAWYVAGAKLTHIIALFLFGALVIGLLITKSDYQAKRIDCFLHPEVNSQQECYQIKQALIAIGSGGWFGRGFGASRQKLMFLPEVSGDAIFPIIGEELGFVFGSALVCLFLFLFFRGFIVAERAPDLFGQILAIGVVSWFAIQAFINIGGMVNIMPMTGVPLPFVSSGGSAVMAGMAALGLLLQISRQVKRR
ncbi:MAG: putative lipid II flippase FtsW [Candidatus Falkowbacteria bacterium]